jgi:hypothetical protein
MREVVRQVLLEVGEFLLADKFEDEGLVDRLQEGALCFSARGAPAVAADDPDNEVLEGDGGPLPEPLEVVHVVDDDDCLLVLDLPDCAAGHLVLHVVLRGHAYAAGLALLALGQEQGEGLGQVRQGLALVDRHVQVLERTPLQALQQPLQRLLHALLLGTGLVLLYRLPVLVRPQTLVQAPELPPQLVDLFAAGQVTLVRQLLPVAQAYLELF